MEKEKVIEELEKKFKFLTQLDETSWLIQSEKNSYMESYFVHIFKDHIIMTGDYNGVMVRPYGNEGQLPNWMAAATTLSYFAEKVFMANQYHKLKQYSPEQAREKVEEIKEYFLENLDDDLSDEDRKEKIKEFDQEVSYVSLECEPEYWDLLNKLENTFDLYDLYEYSPEVYTSQLKWQHKCLLFWATKVLDGSFKKKNNDENNM